MRSRRPSRSGLPPDVIALASLTKNKEQCSKKTLLEGSTLASVGHDLDLTVERIRQIRNAAIRRLLKAAGSELTHDEFLVVMKDGRNAPKRHITRPKSETPYQQEVENETQVTVSMESNMNESHQKQPSQESALDRARKLAVERDNLVVTLQEERQKHLNDIAEIDLVLLQLEGSTAKIPPTRSSRVRAARVQSVRERPPIRGEVRAAVIAAVNEGCKNTREVCKKTGFKRPRVGAALSILVKQGDIKRVSQGVFSPAEPTQTLNNY